LFRKAIIVIVVLLYPFFSQAQVSREKKALKFIEKHRYSSAYVLLKKALAKDSGNVKAKYVFAEYYRRPKNQDYHLDSAYKFIRRAMDSWKEVSPRERAKLEKFPIDSSRLAAFQSEIERSAFEEAKTINTEQAYEHYIIFYPSSSHKGAAVALRDKVSFEAVVTENTPNAFLSFLSKYPSSEYASAAKQRYDYLIFQEGTRDRNLEAYASYLKANPHSPYRVEVEQNIFEIMTADGSPESFEGYLTQYPRGYFSKRAKDLLFHLLTQEQRNLYPEFPQSDSLSRVEELDEMFLIPFMQKEKFGLINVTGRVVIEPAIEELDPRYLCGNISDDIIVLPGRLATKDGTIILKEDVESLDDLGSGFLLAELSNGNINILHKSGFVFPEQNVQNARVVAGKFISILKDDHWGLFTLAGRRILENKFQGIDAIGNVLVLQVDDKFTLTTVPSLAATANNEKGRYTDAFDEVKQILTDKVWIREKEFEGILDQKLEIFVKMDTHKISPSYFGVVATSARGFSTFNEFGEESEVFQKIQVVKPWVAARNASGWMLYDPHLRIAKSVSYDSVSIHGPYAVGIKKDGIEIHIQNRPENLLILPPQDKIEYLPGSDSSTYLVVQRDKKWTVYGSKGEKLFTAGYERIQSAGSGLFIVSNKEKKGLVNSTGKVLLPVEYDAIGSALNGPVSLLKSMKFGLFDHRTKRLIKPEFEKNIVKYNPQVFSVYKNGLWGFIGADNKPMGKVEYQEIVHWTDSVALLRTNDQWSFYDIYARKPVMENVKSYSVIRNTPGEKLFIVNQNGESGVLSNRDGIIIPLKFSDIVNVGSQDNPVYFTEKHVPEASLFVVIYYNAQGQFLRKDVYEQDEYDRIYCNRKKQS
jgi:hypothetical protein